MCRRNMSPPSALNNLARIVHALAPFIHRRTTSRFLCLLTVSRLQSGRPTEFVANISSIPRLRCRRDLYLVHDAKSAELSGQSINVVDSDDDREPTTRAAMISGIVVFSCAGRPGVLLVLSAGNPFPRLAGVQKYENFGRLSHPSAHHLRVRSADQSELVWPSCSGFRCAGTSKQSSNHAHRSVACRRRLLVPVGYLSCLLRTDL